MPRQPARFSALSKPCTRVASIVNNLHRHADRRVAHILPHPLRASGPGLRPTLPARRTEPAYDCVSGRRAPRQPRAGSWFYRARPGCAAPKRPGATRGPRRGAPKITVTISAPSEGGEIRADKQQPPRYTETSRMRPRRLVSYGLQVSTYHFRFNCRHFGPCHPAAARSSASFATLRSAAKHELPHLSST